MLNPRLWLVVLAAIISVPAWATVPQALSYQGYLTDRVGSPIADSQTITFSIYTVPVGGVPVWEETKPVAFSNGLFSTRLGELVAFPPDLFNVPLWIGMTVGTDSEMEPRRSLTSAGFTFRAENADTLQGQSAAELDQSGHVDDLSNPHAATAAQTGAVDTGTFGLHTVAVNAHHARYADAEAVFAMGPVGTGNPLNHDRYSDGEAVDANAAAVSTLTLATIANAGAIAANRVDIDANAAEISTISQSMSGFSLFSNGDRIGSVLGIAGSRASSIGSITVMNDAGYLVTYESNGEVDEIDTFYYEADNCVGTPLVTAHPTSASTGFVYRGFDLSDPTSFSLYYVPKGTVAQTFFPDSRQTATGCTSYNSSLRIMVEVVENDPIVTGVSLSIIPLPMTVGFVAP